MARSLALAAAALLSGVAAGLPMPASVLAAKALLNGKTLRCGVHNIQSDCAPLPARNSSGCATCASACSSVGTGFCYSLNPALLGTIANAPWGTAVPVPSDQLDGAAMSVVSFVANTAGVNLEMYAARVPPAITTNSDSTLSYLYMQNDMGLDCSVYAVTQQYERKQYMRYTIPFTPYGFQVVGPRPAIVEASFATQMFRLLTAFDSNVWLLTVLSVIVSGPLMTFLERSHGRSDFVQHRKDGTVYQMGQGLYLSAMGLSEHDFFTSVTPAGRLYSAFKAMVLFLLMAMYDSKLCAFLSLPTKPVQTIAGMDDLVSTGLPACSRTHSNTFNYIKYAYPSVYKSLVSPGKPNFYNSSMLEYPGTQLFRAFFVSLQIGERVLFCRTSTHSREGCTKTDADPDRERSLNSHAAADGVSPP